MNFLELGDLGGLLRSANDAPLSLVARWSQRAPGEEGPWEPVATYRLDVESFLVWRYTVTSATGQVDYEAENDGVTYHRHEGSHHAKERIPRNTTRDNPWFFYSWLALPETWVVEFVRPLDLLALVFVDAATTDPASASNLHMTVRPIGREPSPYGGIAQPHRSTCQLVLDRAEGVIREAKVRQAGELTDHLQLLEIHRPPQPDSSPANR